MPATKSKADRFLRFKDGLLVITEGKASESYRLTAHRSECGRHVVGYRLAKKNGESYDVQPQEDACECMGYLRWGRCKHLAAVAKLLELRLIGGA